MATTKNTPAKSKADKAAPKSKITSAKQAERNKVTAELRKALGVPEGLCLSGSGQAASERFAPGGDAKLKSQFLTQFRSGKAADRAKAVKLATLLGWEARLTEAKPKPVRKAKAVAADAPAESVDA